MQHPTEKFLENEKKISFYTYGCKLNQYESQGMADQLKESYDISFNGEEADIFIFNSCTVTSEAERKLRQHFRSLKKKNKNAFFIATGCYSQLDRREFEDLGFDLILGVEEKTDIRNYIENKELNDKESRFFTISEYKNDHTRAFIGIQDGCLNTCAYCRIRLARGNKIKSKPVKIVKQEIRALVKNGYKEIVLTGINILYYRANIKENLFGLLQEIREIDGDFRVRLSSLDPKLIDFKLVDFILFEKKFVNHFHLSLQSGSDEILKKMNRNYKTEDYLKIVEYCRKKDRKFSFTTDIIVGFPGESERNFMETLSFIQRINFLKIHVFRFSPRMGTAAYLFKDKVNAKLKKERAKLLIKKAEETKKTYLNGNINTISRVLVEENANNYSKGYDQYYIYHYLSGVFKPNTFVLAKINKVYKDGVISDEKLL